MYGTDQLLWPNLMAQSVNIIETAGYLTPEQKRDILVQQRDAVPAALSK